MVKKGASRPVESKLKYPTMGILWVAQLRLRCKMQSDGLTCSPVLHTYLCPNAAESFPVK